MNRHDLATPKANKHIQEIIDQQLEREKTLYPVRMTPTTVIYVTKERLKTVQTDAYKEKFRKKMIGY